jgi:hypothetical protein
VKIARAESIEFSMCSNRSCSGVHVRLLNKAGKVFAEAILNPVEAAHFGASMAKTVLEAAMGEDDEDVATLQ